MQKTALITQLLQTHCRLWRPAKSQLPWPPRYRASRWWMGTDSWNRNAISIGPRWQQWRHEVGVWNAQSWRGSLRVPRRAPQLSPETHREWESLSQAGVPGAPGIPGVTSEAKPQIQLLQAQRLFPGKSTMLSRKLRTEQMPHFSPPFAHTFFFPSCHYLVWVDLCIPSLVRLTMPTWDW